MNPLQRRISFPEGLGLTSARRKAVVKALSGQEILEALVGIADEADKRFTPDLLKDFWKPFEGHYARFVRDIAASFGLNERPLYHSHEPISGYNKQHHITKREAARLWPHLHFVDASVLERMAKDDQLLLVSYHIWYSLCSSTSYFDSRFVTGLDSFLLKLRGMREESEVSGEVAAILKPHQLNPSESPLETLTSQPRDLFEYKGRLFTLPQEVKDYTQNDGGWVDIIWALGAYTRWPETIGYVLLQEQLSSRAGLFLPEAKV